MALTNASLTHESLVEVLGCLAEINDRRDVQQAMGWQMLSDHVRDNPDDPEVEQVLAVPAGNPDVQLAALMTVERFDAKSSPSESDDHDPTGTALEWLAR